MTVKVETEKSLVVDISKWKLRNFVAFQNAAKEQDYNSLIDELMLIISDWKFMSDPKVQESYFDLDLDDWVELTKAAGELIGNKFTRGN